MSHLIGFEQFMQFRGHAIQSLSPEERKDPGGHEGMQWKWSKTFPGGQESQLSSAGPAQLAHEA